MMATTTPASPRKTASSATQGSHPIPSSPFDVAFGDADGDGWLWGASRSTIALPMNGFPPALAVTIRGQMPPAEGGEVTITRTCDLNACAPAVKAAVTIASEAVVLLLVAETAPCPAFARLVSTEVCDSLVCSPTTWTFTPDADSAASV